MQPELVPGGIIALALAIYALTAGADFGGGVWDLLASGPRRRAQQELIARAIAPIWEANHVWLILVVVLMFVCYPAAYARISVVLHIPLTLLLVGIVLRGAAFVFRAYEPGGGHWEGWSRIFAASSALSPVMLGVVLGAILSGQTTPANGFFSPWLGVFPWALGGMVLAWFALVAAVYLCVEAAEDLAEDFRRRALAAQAALGVLAFGVLGLAQKSAPLLWESIGRDLAFHGATALCALGVGAALWRRRFALARALVIAQSLLLVLGWAMAQWPLVIPPDLTMLHAAAPRSVLEPVLCVLAAGSLVLGPALWWLFRVFKGGRT